MMTARAAASWFFVIAVLIVTLSISLQMFGAQAADEPPRSRTTIESKEPRSAPRSTSDTPFVARKMPVKWNVNAIRPSPEKKQRLRSFVRAQKRALGLSRYDRLKPEIERSTNRSGERLTRYAQFYRGVRVHGALFTVIERNGYVHAAVDQTVKGLNLNPKPTFRFDKAAEYAKEHYTKLNQNFASNAPLAVSETDLLFHSRTPSEEPSAYRLAYRANVEAGILGSTLTIDAMTGELISHEPLQLNGQTLSQAEGLTVYEDLQGPFPVLTDDETNTSILNSDRIVTRSLKDTPAADDTASNIFVDAPEYESADTTFDDSDHPPGVTAHWAAHENIKAYQDWFGLDLFSVPVFGKPDPVIPHINLYPEMPLAWTKPPNSAAPAFYRRSLWPPTILFAGGEEGHLTTTDVVGHEMGHVLLDRAVVALEYQGEAGALNEGFADMMGQISEIQSLGATDWKAVQKMPFSIVGKRRNLANPGTSIPKQPDTYGGAHWADPTNLDNDNGGVHINSGVFNYWLYKVVEMQGLDFRVVANLIVDAYLSYLPENGDYTAARNFIVYEAGESCGAFSRERVTLEQEWHLSGVGPENTTIFQPTPADGATGIDPFPVKLLWQADGDHGTETSWQIQISTSEDFESDVETHATTSTEQTNVGLMGALEVDLDPNTEYFWRVRQTPSNPLLEAGCWRPTLSFTTGSFQTVTLSPAVVSKKAPKQFHPWDLEFKWKEHPKATHYDLEVAKDLGFNQMVTREIGLTGDTKIIDVLMDQKLYWRVKPHGEHNGKLLEGSWSEPERFHTSLPDASPLHPEDGKGTRAWPVILNWNHPAGAQFFEIDLSNVRGQSKSHVFAMGRKYDGNGKLGNELVELKRSDFPMKIPPDTNKYEVHVNADDDEMLYNWSIRAVGPLVGNPGIPNGVDYVQESTNAITHSFAPKWTHSYIFRPSYLDGKNGCPKANSNIEIEFGLPLNATSYTLFAEPRYCGPAPECQIRPALIKRTDIVCPAIPPPNNVCVIKEKFDLPGPSGYNIFMQARQHRLLGEIYKPKNIIMLQPDEKPEPLWPINETIGGGEDVFHMFRWQGIPNSHGYVVEIKRGYDTDSVIAEANDPGESSVPISLSCQTNYGSKCHHQWRVRAHVKNWGSYADQCDEPPWSNWTTFHVSEGGRASGSNTSGQDKPAQPSLPPLIVYEGQEVTIWHIKFPVASGVLHAMFGKQDDADEYILYVRETANHANNGTYAYKEADLESAKEQVLNKVCYDQPGLGFCENGLAKDPLVTLPDMWVVTVPMGQPATAYEAQLAACKDDVCSDPSPW